MLNLPPEAGPVIISPALLILAYIVSRQPIKQVTILGVSLFTDKLMTLITKTGIGVLCGSIFFTNPVELLSLTSALITGTILFNVANGINEFECANFVSKVPMERVCQGKTIGFLELPQEKTPKVFIKGSEDTDLYVPSHNENDLCSSEPEKVEMKKSNPMIVKSHYQTSIHRKCERKYVPLKEWTKTLADVKKEDSTENREKASKYIKRYENRINRIINEIDDN